MGCQSGIMMMPLQVIGRIVKEMETMQLGATSARAESQSAGQQLVSVQTDLDVTKAVLRHIRKTEGEQEALASVSIVRTRCVSSTELFSVFFFESSMCTYASERRCERGSLSCCDVNPSQNGRVRVSHPDASRAGVGGAGEGAPHAHNTPAPALPRRAFALTAFTLRRTLSLTFDLQLAIFLADLQRVR